MRQNEAERCSAENGDPNDVFASDLVAHRASDERPRRRGEEEDEQDDLRLRDRDTENVDDIKGEVIGQRSHINVFGEDENRDDDEGPCGHPV